MLVAQSAHNNGCCVSAEFNSAVVDVVAAAYKTFDIEFVGARAASKWLASYR